MSSRFLVPLLLWLALIGGTFGLPAVMLDAQNSPATVTITYDSQGWKTIPPTQCASAPTCRETPLLSLGVSGNTSGSYYLEVWVGPITTAMIGSGDAVTTLGKPTQTTVDGFSAERWFTNGGFIEAVDVGLGDGRKVWIEYYNVEMFESRAQMRSDGTSVAVDAMTVLGEVLAEAIIQTFHFTVHAASAPPAPASSECVATIAIPADLQPGAVLSPSVTVTTVDGKQPEGMVQVVWVINGQPGASAIWDGRTTTVELQLSCQNHAYSLTKIVPAYTGVPPVVPPDVPPAVPPDAPPAVPPDAPPAVPPDAPPDSFPNPNISDLLSGGTVPGLTGVGSVPGPRNLIEGLISIFVPAIIGVLTGLLSGGGMPVPTPSVPIPASVPPPTQPAVPPPPPPTQPAVPPPPPPTQPAVPPPPVTSQVGQAISTAERIGNGLDTLQDAVGRTRAELGRLPLDSATRNALDQQMQRYQDALSRGGELLKQPANLRAQVDEIRQALRAVDQKFETIHQIYDQSCRDTQDLPPGLRERTGDLKAAIRVIGEATAAVINRLPGFSQIDSDGLFQINESFTAAADGTERAVRTLTRTQIEAHALGMDTFEGDPEKLREIREIQAQGRRQRQASDPQGESTWQSWWRWLQGKPKPGVEQFR